MPTFNSAKGHSRRVLVSSMRACIAHDRVPWAAKNLYVNGCQRLLTALGIESDETPIQSEYGTKFVAGPGSPYLNSILRYRGVHEPVLSEFILRHAQEGDVCVDAGANCGYFSLLLAQRVAPSGKVIAIEAEPGNVRKLRANLELNGAVGIVDVVMAACAQQQGEITFYLHPHNDCWARISPPTKGELDRRYMGKTWIPVTVAADTLSSIVGREAKRVSFIKLDIEGAEAAVTPEIAANFPHPGLVVALEAKAPHIEATLKPFEDAGFYVYDLHNDYRWIFERKEQAITEADYGDFTDHNMVDVLLSRQPLVLW